MTEIRPPEGLREVGIKAIRETFGYGEVMAEAMTDTVLAALFDACTAREQPHMWLGDGSRGPRSLVLTYQLPDEPMPKPGPMPPALAEALAKVRATMSGGPA